MKALITGASSGIGRDISIILSKKGYDLILVARRQERLEELKSTLDTEVQTICLDLSKEESCFELYDQVKNEDIDVLINNAGFGIFGIFDSIDIQDELRLIDTNIKAVHILTKLFLVDFKRKNSGYILNVASSAGFLPGPLLSSYYASKAYVLRLTQAIYEELRREGSSVYVGSLCPGPVDTEFNQTANVKMSLKGLTSQYVAEYAIKQMFKRKLTIIPGKKMKLAVFFQKFLPEKLLLKISYHMQKKKEG
ncbi:SDR family oxidoreductase [Ruminiclostridium herbifermentans]|uniref:SDR family oxidoreductase n=1 Tax=Ruminiclostridium herbifermentans TaxID=2488810 RepID=A0A4U7JF19_9FIRM|nr:SDR family oxidoreductase [Ruminiclostridium herbifermentans]QNU67351.1 SDR family oxidoreductase [Ruminiclostridium herbifermentans]